ncbi:MAG: hypothetical protein HFJ80_06795 [Clostridiales bacterium]|nr:hypothetical protein [Clostridiales bacterium]
MEIISKEDVLNEIRGAREPGTMNLMISVHKVHLHYSERGKSIVSYIDGELIKDCHLTALYHLLDDLTEHKRLKIKMSNEPQSKKWRRIQISDEEMEKVIRQRLIALGVKSRCKGYVDLCEIISMVCKEHIAGHVVDAVKLADKLASKHGIKRLSMDHTIRMAVEDHLCARTEWQIKELIRYCSRPCAGARAFILNFAHSLLDEWAAKNSS